MDPVALRTHATPRNSTPPHTTPPYATVRHLSLRLKGLGRPMPFLLRDVAYSEQCHWLNNPKSIGPPGVRCPFQYRVANTNSKSSGLCGTVNLSRSKPYETLDPSCSCHTQDLVRLLILSRSKPYLVFVPVKPCIPGTGTLARSKPCRTLYRVVLPTSWDC